LPNGSATPEVEVASVKTERRPSDSPTNCTLLENQTGLITRDLVDRLVYDVLQQDTRHLPSSHSESDVTNGPFLGGRRLQTPVDANCDSFNTISDAADFIDSVVEVKVKVDPGADNEHQFAGSDTLTNEPSVKLAFDSVQCKTDVMDSDTQPEIANGSDFAPHFTEQQKRSVSVIPYQCKTCGFKCQYIF